MMMDERKAGSGSCPAATRATWKRGSDCYHGREAAKNEYRVEGTESTPLQSRRLYTLECRV